MAARCCRSERDPVPEPESSTGASNRGPPSTPNGSTASTGRNSPGREPVVLSGSRHRSTGRCRCTRPSTPRRTTCACRGRSSAPSATSVGCPATSCAVAQYLFARGADLLRLRGRHRAPAAGYDGLPPDPRLQVQIDRPVAAAAADDRSAAEQPGRVSVYAWSCIIAGTKRSDTRQPVPCRQFTEQRPDDGVRLGGRRSASRQIVAGATPADRRSDAGSEISHDRLGPPVPTSPPASTTTATRCSSTGRRSRAISEAIRAPSPRRAGLLDPNPRPGPAIDCRAASRTGAWTRDPIVIDMSAARTLAKGVTR